MKRLPYRARKSVWRWAARVGLLVAWSGMLLGLTGGLLSPAAGSWAMFFGGGVGIEGDKDVDDPPDRSGRYPGGLQGNLLVLSPQAFSGSPGRACRFLEDCALFVVDFPHVERVRQAT